MAESKKVVLTREGLKEKEDRLEYLNKYLKVDIAEKLKEARSYGDLSENAEYDAAKNEQAEVAAEIEKLEEMLKNVEILSEDSITTNCVTNGVKVLVKDCDLDEEMTLNIVDSTEANILNKENELDFSNMKIPQDSALGTALMGKKEGDKVEVHCDAGIITYKILKITK